MRQTIFMSEIKISFYLFSLSPSFKKKKGKQFLLHSKIFQDYVLDFLYLFFFIVRVNWELIIISFKVALQATQKRQMWVEQKLGLESPVLCWTRTQQPPLFSGHLEPWFPFPRAYDPADYEHLPVSAEVKEILTIDDINTKTNPEIDKIINDSFTFDNFKWQQENKIVVDEPFRADGLERILYKCPSCNTEGKTKGKGEILRCKTCEKVYYLGKYGDLKTPDKTLEFSHIPDWYNWEREEVKKEILNGIYRLDEQVEIGMIVDYKCLYMIGKGRLIHDQNGFTLTSDDGKLHYTQPPTASHTLNADYYWYEIGDVISIGDKKALYYCFVKDGVSVAKARLATEEMFKLSKNK